MTTAINELEQIRYSNQIILTTEQLADFYGTDSRHIKQNFRNNKKRFIEGKHYYFLKDTALKEFKNEVDNINLVGKRTSSLYLWTAQGASRHSKILGTDQAWNVFDELEDNYFKRPVLQNPSSNISLLDLDSKTLLLVADFKQQNEKLQLENKQLKEQVEQNKTIVDYAKKIIADRSDLNDITLIANKLTNAGYQMGRNKVMAWMRMKGHLLKQNSKYNYPGQVAKDAGFLVAEEKTVEYDNHHGGTQKTTYVQTYATKTGITWFTNQIIKWLEDGHDISEVKGY